MKSPVTGAISPAYGFQYNGEGRIWSMSNSGGLDATYYEDAVGQRAQKLLSNGQSVIYVYDAFGNLAEQYSPYNVWSKDYIFLNGEAAAIENASANPCGTCYLSGDHLGTVRMGHRSQHQHHHAPRLFAVWR